MGYKLLFHMQDAHVITNQIHVSGPSTFQQFRIKNGVMGIRRVFFTTINRNITCLHQCIFTCFPVIPELIKKSKTAIANRHASTYFCFRS